MPIQNNYDFVRYILLLKKHKVIRRQKEVAEKIGSTAQFISGIMQNFDKKSRNYIESGRSSVSDKVMAQMESWLDQHGIDRNEPINIKLVDQENQPMTSEEKQIIIDLQRELIKKQELILSLKDENSDLKIKYEKLLKKANKLIDD
jgi:hypothetical protein